MSSTLQVLRNRALDLADMTNSGFADTTLSTGMVDRQINASAARFYDLLIDLNLDDIAVNYSNLTVSSSSDEADLPTDFYRMKKLIYKDADGTWYPLKRLDLSNIDLQHVGTNTITSNSELLYQVSSSWVVASLAYKYIVRFSQNPATGGTFTVYYAPFLPEMSLNTHVLPILVPLSWEDWIVCDVAAYLLAREESDSSMVLAQREKVEFEIRAAATNRYLNDPAVMRDTNRRF